MNLSFDEMAAAAVVGVVLAVALTILGIKVRGWRRIAAFFCVPPLFLPAAIILLALNPWLVDTRFRSYRAFYRSIDVGMTTEQVLREMEKIYPESGPRRRPEVFRHEEDAMGFFMNPEHSKEPNCEGIFLNLKDGRVVSKGYSRD